tara:strand:- start:71 stop:463 length:393 start_codon:yes stop_codon:yes gene_type:complete
MRFTKKELEDDLAFIADITELPLADPFYENVENKVTSFASYGDQALRDIYYELSDWFDLWIIRVEDDKQGDREYTLGVNQTWRTLKKLYFYLKYENHKYYANDYIEYKFYRSKNYVKDVPSEYELWRKGK